MKKGADVARRMFFHIPRPLGWLSRVLSSHVETVIWLMMAGLHRF